MTKELEALKRIWEMTGSNKDYKLVETALKNYENSQRIETEVEKYYYKTLVDNENKKKLKALEIIKEKDVYVGDFIDTFIVEELSYQHYLKYHDNYSYKLLTQEEFDTLKEGLK